MKTKALIFLLMAAAASLSTLQAGPTVFFRSGGQNACGPALVRPTPVFFQPAFCRPAPVFYQPFFSTPCFNPVFYSIGPTTVTFNSGPINGSSVSPLVVPPPVILNRPVTVPSGATFTWKH